jgi:Protein of unknown function (DUF3060)
MTSEDDPEARIRELERPLKDQARASELGGGAPDRPPPTAAYPSDYNTPAYGTQPYGMPYSPPPKTISGGIPWAVFGLIALVLIAVAAGIVVFTTKMSGVADSKDSSVSSGDGSIDIPTFPSIEVATIPAPPGAPQADPTAIAGAPGESLTVSGIENNKAIACNDATVTISGIRNTVTITGHCVSVQVSGMNNVVAVDIADTIGASGFDNRITYHAGSPQVDANGSNVVEQG